MRTKNKTKENNERRWQKQKEHAKKGGENGCKNEAMKMTATKN